MNYFIHKAFILLLLLSVGAKYAFADEVYIEANIGDRTSQFRLKPEHGDFVMSYQANYLKVSKTLIGKKNYQYVVRVVNELISTASQSKVPNPLLCHRDQTLVQYTHDLGKVTSTKLCLLDHSAQSEVILNLINTMVDGI